MLQKRSNGLKSMRINKNSGNSLKEKRGNDKHALNSELSLEKSTDSNKLENCKDRPHICGPEAACRHFPNNNTSLCVCPNDGSIPTHDLKCPNRSIMSASESPVAIPNVLLRGNQLRPDTNDENKTLISFDSQLDGSHDNEGSEKVFVPALSIAFIFIILGTILFFRRRRRFTKKVEHKTYGISPINLKDSSLLPIKYTSNSLYFGFTPLEVPILRRDNLTFMYDIGEGCFGKVYKGELCHGDSKEIVAVKVLKESASRAAEEDFMREVETMSAFHHENILSLIGVVQRDAVHGPCMVFEYMPYGDLNDVLRSNSRQLKNQIPGLEPLNRHSLHYIAVQIAAGMTYLSAQRFVHRDLACRNCLVGLDLVVKIADFGMSRDVYTCDYYKMGGSRMLPVRWMPLESVLYGRFTLESDVWSFGVVLWEIYSYGKQPYYGHNNDEVVKLILQGIMLIPPEDCPPFICKIMADCWKTEPRDRCKFPEILERLEKAQESLEKFEINQLPRPPQGPVAVKSSVDTDGYLVPAKIPDKPEYLEPIPSNPSDPSPV